MCVASLLGEGVEEDATDANRAPEQLDRREGLAEDEGDADDDDDALGGVGDRLGDGVGLLDRQGGELVVTAEYVAKGEQSERGRR